MGTKRLFLYLLIASVGVSAILGVWVILFGQYGDLELKIVGTSTTLTAMSLVGLACGASIESGRLRLLPLSGIIFAIVSAAIWIVIIWSEREPDELVLKTVFTTTILACAAAYCSLLAFGKLDKRFRWAQYGAFGAVGFLSAVLFYIIWINNQPDEDLFGRIIGADSVLIAALTVIVPIFHKLSSHGDELGEIENEINRLRNRLAELEEKKKMLDVSKEIKK